jgi:hypothetical protein
MFMDTKGDIRSYNYSFQSIFNLKNPFDASQKNLNFSSLVSTSDFQNILNNIKKWNGKKFHVAFMIQRRLIVMNVEIIRQLDGEMLCFCLVLV